MDRNLIERLAGEQLPTAWRYKYLGQWHLSDEMPGEGASYLTPLFETPAEPVAGVHATRLKSIRPLLSEDDFDLMVRLFQALTRR